MPLDRLINILVTVTLIEMMVLIGLRVTFAEIVNTVRSWPLIARAVAANYLLVPVLAIVLLILFAANPMVAVGFGVLDRSLGAPELIARLGTKFPMTEKRTILATAVP